MLETLTTIGAVAAAAAPATATTTTTTFSASIGARHSIVKMFKKIYQSL